MSRVYKKKYEWRWYDKVSALQVYMKTYCMSVETGHPWDQSGRDFLLVYVLYSKYLG